MPNVLAAVKELRERLGDTQQAFASRLGVSISAVTNYERNRIPTGRSLVKLMQTADAYGYSDLAMVFQDELSEELGFRVPRLIGSDTAEILPEEQPLIDAVLTVSRGGKRWAKVRSELERVLKPVMEVNTSKNARAIRDVGWLQELHRRIAAGESDEKIALAMRTTTEQVQSLRTALEEKSE